MEIRIEKRVRRKIIGLKEEEIKREKKRGTERRRAENKKKFRNKKEIKEGVG